jgi:hypothetical protein
LDFALVSLKLISLKFYSTIEESDEEPGNMEDKPIESASKK